jgi:PAS domain S-box-containing protein
MKLHSAVGPRRTVFDLCLAFVIAFMVLLLNVFITLSEHVHAFFREYARIPATAILANGLFFWLAVLLWVAFRRWRESARQLAELEDIISSISPDVLLVLRNDRTIVMCNSSVRRVFAYAPEEVLNRKTDMLYFDRRTDNGTLGEIREPHEKDGFPVGMAMGRRRNGETVPLEIISGELSGRAGAVLLLRDISERLRLEGERRQLEVQAQQSQRLESLGVLAGGAAHDFKNLVGIIQGHTDLILANERGSAAALEHMTEIATATDRAAKLCAHLLSFAGKEPVLLRPLDVSAITEETLRLLRVSVPNAVLVEARLRRDIPAVQGDAVQVQQIAMNLIKNAIESLKGGSGTVTVSTDVQECDASFLGHSITTEHLSPGRYVCLRVADTGCGMDQRTQQRVFEPFFTTKRDGHGMGLAAVLGLVRGHRGGVLVESVPGKGSTFTILFPA